MVRSKKFVLASQFDGPPKETDLELVEEELLPLRDGGNIYIIELQMCIVFVVN